MIKIDNKGFSLIELVTFIIIGGIILPVSMIAFRGTLGNFSTPDYQVKARFYAEQRMELITSNAYGKTYFGRSVPTGVVADPSSELETGFGRTWSVCYVPANNIAYDLCDITNDTYYQKITVEITNPSGIAYKVSTIITLRPKASTP